MLVCELLWRSRWGSQKEVGFDELLDHALDTEGNEALIREVCAALEFVRY